MAYGSNQRRDRAALQSLRYTNRSYPIMIYPSSKPQDVYGNSGNISNFGGSLFAKQKPKRSKYGKDTNYGWIPLVTSIIGAIGGQVSNHVLQADANAANAAIAANQQVLDLEKEKNRPYLYMAGAFVIGAMALGTAAIFRG
jgi:hypothetical protein